MATKKEVKDLQEEVRRLNEIIFNLNSELSNETNMLQEEILKNQSLTQQNNYLVDELFRIQKSDSTNRRIQTDLMFSISVLGRHIATNFENEFYHNCDPATRTLCMEETNQKKS